MFIHLIGTVSLSRIHFKLSATEHIRDIGKVKS